MDAALGEMFIDIHVPGQGWRERFVGICSVPLTRGLLRASLRDFTSQIAELLVFGGFQPAYLAFERSDACHLANTGGDPEAQQIARDIKSTSGEISLIGILLHRFGTRQFLREMIENLRMDFVV